MRALENREIMGEWPLALVMVLSPIRIALPFMRRE
jgi:hypothetical protein